MGNIEKTEFQLPDDKGRSQNRGGPAGGDGDIPGAGISASIRMRFGDGASCSESWLGNMTA